LKNIPAVDANSLSLQTWRRIGPLSIDDFINNSQIQINFDEKIYEFGQRKINGGVCIG